MSDLDRRVAELARRDRALAEEILRECIRIPADYVDRPPEEGGDPLCGLSNHEGPRFRYLRDKIVEIGAVRRPEDVGFDAFGNLVWFVEDPDDGVAPDDKKVIFLDGHGDTVAALRDQWRAKTGGGIDAYEGLVDPARVDRDFLRAELGWLPPDDEWDNLLFGRGSADQLGGVVAQVVASRILLELAPEGALRGVRVVSYVTAAEEDNDGGGPMYVVGKVLPDAPPAGIPDVVILTEGTGHAERGALGIYRGQRGRMQIEVDVLGRSAHGSMPHMGLNPLEHGAAILVEAAEQAARGEGFLDHAFLGAGTRTASWAELTTPSDCAVPDRFRFRFDRRLTAGERPEDAVAAIEGLPAVARARAAGLEVTVRVPRYEQPTWRGYAPGNPQIYRGWETPADHPVLAAALAAYRGVITPEVDPAVDARPGGGLKREPRLERWIFSTDGVGWQAEEGALPRAEAKGWLREAGAVHPPMFGLGPGIEHNTHKVGEVLDTRELQHAIAFLARYPSVLAATT